ncbi:hypothetical protein [Hymenobacter glacieicola]|uniref:Uncharacterized protein n=1 Tax=Hymenobacter glacieicola TaxID=1562124 RepID=A0ABQ1WYJ8_9BACT|nr:hypothetical protein [Hymenobacter glacieicola]GGG50324.1 hypothetical protein GCM10011378_28080 [Hymenobacter glacieicola]
MKTPKKALAADITALLAPLLPTPVPAAGLPKGVQKAIEEMADTILRWRAKQERPVRSLTSARGTSSDSDELAQLMNSRLYQEEPEAAETAPLDLASSQAEAPPLNSLSETPPPLRKRRPRLGAS